MTGQEKFTPAFTPEDVLWLCTYTVLGDDAKITEWVIEHITDNAQGWTLLATLGALFEKVNPLKLGENDLLVIHDNGADVEDAWADLSAARIFTTTANGERMTAAAIINTVIEAGQEAFFRVLVSMLSTLRPILAQYATKKDGS
jgi:hypothetical protein